MKFTRARAMELLFYCPETGQFTWRRSRPGQAKVGSVAGTVERSGYRYVIILGHRYVAHRLAWLFHFGDWPKGEIDHIDYQVDVRAVTARNDGLSPEDEMKAVIDTPVSGFWLWLDELDKQAKEARNE